MGILAFAISAVLSLLDLESIEGLLYDARLRSKPVSAKSGLVSLVAIDKPTFEKLGRAPNATDHLQFLKAIKQAEPKAIIYLVNPEEITGSREELEALAKEMASTERLVVALNDVAIRGETNPFALPPPFQGLSALSAPTTSDRNIFARDDVTRRMLISYGGQLTLHPQLAALVRPNASDEPATRGLFEYLGSKQTYIDFRPTGSYPVLSFSSMLGDSISLPSLRDQFVIVGRDIQSTSKDYIRTPFRRDIVAMTVLEMHANMLDTSLLNSAPVRTSRALDVTATALVAFVAIYAVLTLKPAVGLALLGMVLLAIALIGWLAFAVFGIWIGLASPILALFVAYYFVVPYRLIQENRRSWEYYEKNKLLVQVEELKTNFLSMMSHDLKTPIARIQGMADVAGQDAHGLSPRQADALVSIRRSADELLEFISSILDLGRIESKELKLKIHSRDLNSIVQEVALKFDDVAKARRIEIVTELEPLFSIRMDVDLVRQVVSNLVENAIKYSPDGSKILISTEEKDGKVVLQVADQGFGIPLDEQSRIFTKFYRSKTVKNSPIKGSGLGLYLSRYFVELHRGQIMVDSRPGEGSTFTVELPTQVAGG
jgi:hypothetical protein